MGIPETTDLESQHRVSKERPDNNVKDVESELDLNGGRLHGQNDGLLPAKAEIETSTAGPTHVESQQNRRSASSLRGVFPIWMTMIFIISLGAVACAAFLAVGITAAKDDQLDQFNRLAQDLTNKIEEAWEDYVTAASWIHGRCRGRNFTRADFRQTYEYLRGSGLDFQAAQFDPNITREEREGAEAEARAFYARHYPHVEYKGIIGFETAESTMLEPRSEQDYYFPIHVRINIRGYCERSYRTVFGI